MIAHQQRIFHRAGRNHERLHQRGGPEQQQNNGYGPFSDYATGDIVAERPERVLCRCLDYVCLFFSH